MRLLKLTWVAIIHYAWKLRWDDNDAQSKRGPCKCVSVCVCTINGKDCSAMHGWIDAHPKCIYQLKSLYTDIELYHYKSPFVYSKQHSHINSNEF